MIAPIEAGIEITIRRLNATSVSVNNGNLSNENSTSPTIIAVIVYAIAIRHKNVGTLYLILPWNTL